MALLLPVPLPNPPGDLLDRRAGERDRERERPPPEMQTSFSVHNAITIRGSKEDLCYQIIILKFQ